MIDFSIIFDGAKDWVQTALGIGGVSSPLIAIIFAWLNYRTKKKKIAVDTENTKLSDYNNKVASEVDVINQNQSTVIKSNQHLANIMTALCLDSGVSVNTKQYIIDEARQINELGIVVKAYDVIKEQAPEILEKTKEVKDAIVEAGTQAVEQVKDIGSDLQNMYNRIVGK